jgi:hypothetical protein
MPSEILFVMFSAQSSIDTVARFALWGGLAAGAAIAVVGLLRSRRLLKLGFTIADLWTKERFFKKWAEIAVQQLPDKISLTPSDSYLWSEASEYENAAAALEKLGLERCPVFIASPQKWIVEFWLCKEEGIFAAILDSGPCGVHTEFMVSYADGSTVSFENTEECGRQHLETHNWIHCGRVRPDQLRARVLKERQPHHVGQMRLVECVQAYERAINESLAWRRKVGFSPAEMKRTRERLRRKRVLVGKLT